MRLPRSVVFGLQQRRAIGSIARDLGQRALICTDARLGADADLKEIVADLSSAGVQTKVYDGTQADLPKSGIAECVASAKEFSPDLVIGIGGGSCMDMAKVVALLLRHGGQVSEYCGELKVPGPILPLIAIPTTSSTGSEVSPVAVVSDAELGTKIGVSSPHMIPLVALCDPELTQTCPPRLTAASGADALTHAVESFTSLARPLDPLLTRIHVFVGKNLFSDHFAKLAVANIWIGLPHVCRDGADIEAREQVMLGALSAGCAFGVAGAAAAHALQYPVGALTHTAHGDGVASLLPYVMQYNLPNCAAGFAELADVVGLDVRSRDATVRAQAFIDAVAALFAEIGIPKSLHDLGLAENQQDAAAEGSLNSGRLVKNNPHPLDLEAMKRITRAAYAGDRAALNAA
jgi:alcohol dehydrogenase class IV